MSSSGRFEGIFNRCRPILLGQEYPKFVCDQFETKIIFEWFDLVLEVLQSNLLPRRAFIMMQSDELVGQSVELWILPADGSVVPSVELTDVQKGDNQEVECIETRFLDGKPTVAVASVSTFDLDPDLSNLARAGLMPRIGMDTNQIVAFVVGRCFVCQDVSAHEIPHDQILGACRNDRQS
jgi:hypothetical protein